MVDSIPDEMNRGIVFPRGDMDPRFQMHRQVRIHVYLLRLDVVVSEGLHIEGDAREEVVCKEVVQEGCVKVGCFERGVVYEGYEAAEDVVG